MSRRTFRVAAVSSNTNSFGLRGHVLIAEDGEAHEASANSLNTLEVGTDIELDPNNFAEHGFEIPRRLPDAPEGVLEEIFA